MAYHVANGLPATAHADDTVSNFVPVQCSPGVRRCEVMAVGSLGVLQFAIDIPSNTISALEFILNMPCISGGSRVVTIYSYESPSRRFAVRATAALRPGPTNTSGVLSIQPLGSLAANTVACGYLHFQVS